jgi:hypothetical protein
MSAIGGKADIGWTGTPFAVIPLEAISSPKKFALKLRRQTPALQQ